MPEIKTLFPPGHFYSPICDPTDLRAREDQIWPLVMPPAETPGIEYNLMAELELLRGFASFTHEIDFPERPQADPTRYYYSNDQYGLFDAMVLFSFVRHLNPNRIIEIGSGFSSLIMAEVNRRFYSARIEITLVEPHPRQFLIDGVPGVSRLVRERVQTVGPDIFESLYANDILFIDSSHVTKTGSDVNFLVFDILPRIRPGVYIHIHDIFLPDEYPKEWVLEQGRNWNEQYIIRAFLQYNRAFRIVWASHLMSTRYPEETRTAFGLLQHLGGGSLWLRRDPTPCGQ